MPRLIPVFSALLAATSGLALAGQPITPAAAGRVPVVVELFTSEGCSSCPAADDVLRDLETSQALPGIEVIALGEHVDYWNRLGWQDPFSAARFSERQRWYAQGFAEGSYTPQAVVDGRYELVGSRRQELTEKILAAAQAPHATVALALPTPGALHVQISDLPAGTPATTVTLAFTETNLATQVSRGENAGRQLRHAAVVRTLRSLGPVAADGTFSATVPLNLAAAWNRPHLRAVVLVQETDSHRVVGVGSLPLGE